MADLEPVGHSSPLPPVRPKQKGRDEPRGRPAGAKAAVAAKIRKRSAGDDGQSPQHVDEYA